MTPFLLSTEEEAIQPQHPQRSTIRHGTLAKTHGLTAWTRVDVPTTRPPPARNQTTVPDTFSEITFPTPFPNRDTFSEP